MRSRDRQAQKKRSSYLRQVPCSSQVSSCRPRAGRASRKSPKSSSYASATSGFSNMICASPNRVSFVGLSCQLSCHKRCPHVTLRPILVAVRLQSPAFQCPSMYDVRMTIASVHLSPEPPRRGADLNRDRLRTRPRKTPERRALSRADPSTRPNSEGGLAPEYRCNHSFSRTPADVR